MELKCEHVNCEYSAKRSELENHEQSCKYRPEEFEEEEDDEDSEDEDDGEEEGMEDDDEAVEDEEEVRVPFCST